MYFMGNPRAQVARRSAARALHRDVYSFVGWADCANSHTMY